MSLLKSVMNLGKKVLSSPILSSGVGKALTPFIPGVGTALSIAGAAYGGYQALKSPSVGSVSPGAGSVMTLPSMGMQTNFSGMGMGASLAGLGGAVVRGGRAAGKAAVSLCRKYPQWCSTIGGTVAVEALLHSGQLPMPKRRRGKGISATELKNFRRVVKFTSKYCAPVHRAMRAPVMHKRR